MNKNQIPEVQQGMIKTNLDGLISVGSSEWGEWVKGATSFRYVPTGSAAPFTVRKEKGTKGQQSYWYGYRKTAGKLAKRYIGREEDLSVARLEEIAELLNSRTEPRQKLEVTETPSVTNTEEIERLQDEIARLQSELQNARKKNLA